MKNWIYAIIIVSILVGAGYVLRYCTEDSGFPTEIPPNDTTYIYGDTVFVPTDTVFTVKWQKIPAITDVDSAGVVTKSAIKDTLLVVGKDSIGVEVNAKYNLSEDTFDMDIDIDFRRYDAIVTNTIEVTNYVPVEAEVDEPFYDEFVWGAGVMTVIFTALILLTGG